MATEMEKLLERWNDGQWLEDGELIALHDRVDQAFATLQMLEASSVTCRGVFEIKTSLEMSMRARVLIIANTAEDIAAMREDFKALMESADYLKGDLERNPWPMIDQLAEASEALQALAPDGILSMHVSDIHARLLAYGQRNHNTLETASRFR